ncbi:MAG: molybdenum cofactor biosynthesis protein MoaE [Acidimicrobiales bacterium]|nr:MAG: molybdenum cofactor biosynthesis protein MoaE [Acidimicrobiales bacterium]
MLEILDSSFDPGKRLNSFSKTSGNAGGIASFIGRVRGERGDVSGLYLESYPGVTEKGIQSATDAAVKRWALVDVLVIHRIGTMSPGEPIVMVITAAEHRRAAFEACDFLMDYLKTDAMFWKKQTGADGEKWIEPRTEDYKDRERWT